MDLSFLRDNTRDIVVTFITQQNDGFGYGADGEQVFIPRSLMSEFDVGRGDAVRCKTVRNDPKFSDRCPWRAYHVTVLRSAFEEEYDNTLGELQVLDGPESYRPSKEEILLQLLEEVEMLSTSHIAQIWNCDSNYARPILDRLHREGKLLRADVFSHGTQTKASRSMWACSDDVFQPLPQGT